jgi:hypothetical protein
MLSHEVKIMILLYIVGFLILLGCAALLFSLGFIGFELIKNLSK